MVCMIMELASNRSAILTTNNSTWSRLRRLMNGIPQGYVLAPLHVNICNSDMPTNVLRHTRGLCCKRRREDTYPYILNAVLIHALNNWYTMTLHIIWQSLASLCSYVNSSSHLRNNCVGTGCHKILLLTYQLPWTVSDAWSFGFFNPTPSSTKTLKIDTDRFWFMTQLVVYGYPLQWNK